MGWVEGPYPLSDAHRIRAATLWVYLFEPWLVASHSTVIIPVDDHVILVRLLNPTKFCGRLSEVAPTLDAISGMQFRVGRRELGRARPESAVVPGNDKGSWRAGAVWGAVYWPQVPDRQ